jgi:ABC-type sugar transport system ATPase subunit
MALPGARRLGLPLRTARDRRATAAQIAALNIQPPLTDIPVSALSGGNQQKVVLARWLPGRPKVWLFDDPTRGVDAQAQADIHRIIRDRVREGACGLLHSSDVRELQRVADRCLLIVGGRIVSQIDTRTLTAEETGALLERTTLTEGTAL